MSRPDIESKATELLPSRAAREELRAIQAADPTLGQLLYPQPDEPERANYELLLSGQSPFYVVPVAVPRRSGTVWASRLPGIRPTFTAEEVDALKRFGVQRVVCLVPTAAIETLHGAYRYLKTVRAAFPDAFHQVEIADHEVPGDDDIFEGCVRDADDALMRGEHVLVHCVGGCGRTGMFVACLMVRAGLEAKAAIRAFRRNRRCGPETTDQLAYVVRYAKRLENTRLSPSEVRVALAENGSPCLLATGGLASIYAGRLRLPGGGSRRVAVKVPHSKMSHETAVTVKDCICALREAGVQLPRMAMLKLADDTWVQVTPLFGSASQGSKLAQPSLFYKSLDSEQKAFAVDQLTRVANAGYSPSMDFFVIFKDRCKGIVPIDLDLVVGRADSLTAARKLLTTIIQLGDNAEERDALLAVGRAVALPALRASLDEVLDMETGFRRCWRLD